LSSLISSKTFLNKISWNIGFVKACIFDL